MVRCLDELCRVAMVKMRIEGDGNFDSGYSDSRDCFSRWAVYGRHDYKFNEAERN
jgi:hypothetical protein